MQTRKPITLNHQPSTIQRRRDSRIGTNLELGSFEQEATEETETSSILCGPWRVAGCPESSTPSAPFRVLRLNMSSFICQNSAVFFSSKRMPMETAESRQTNQKLSLPPTLNSQPSKATRISRMGTHSGKRVRLSSQLSTLNSQPSPFGTPAPTRHAHNPFRNAQIETRNGHVGTRNLRVPVRNMPMREASGRVPGSSAHLPIRNPCVPKRNQRVPMRNAQVPARHLPVPAHLQDTQTPPSSKRLATGQFQKRALPDKR